MRLVTFRTAADPHPRLGLLRGTDATGGDGAILPLDELPALGADARLRPALEAGDLVALLAADPGLEATARALGRMGTTPANVIDRAAVRLMAPLLRPGKIVCVGLNYRDHVAEQRIALPDRPLLFAKFANAIAGDGDPIVRHARTAALDLEAELGVVVGRRAHRVAAAEAMTHVAGYTVVDDVSARDLQGIRQALPPDGHGDGQWLRAKGSDTFCPIGPALVTADEVADPTRLAVRSWRTVADGTPAGRTVAMQDGTTADMVFGITELIAYISEVITLEPGDLVATGTPAGVGVFREPPVFLEPGDVATIEVEGIGRIGNPVVDAAGAAPPGSPAERFLRERAAFA